MLLAPEGRGEEISTALRAIARRARRQVWGCKGFEVYACVENANRILMQVDWSDARAMATYVGSDDFTDVLTIVELSPEPPIFEFRVGEEVRGLDYLAEVRSGEPADT